MTILNNTFDDMEALKELLIKNLPSQIYASNEKAAFKSSPMKTIKGLEYDFISFNSKSRVSFMVFDIDYVGEVTAKEYYAGSIDNLLERIMFVIGMEPSCICVTNKGFQFAYHIGNPIFTHQPKAVAYLSAIKNSIIEKLGCDPVASGRNYGVFRNPIRHTHYFSGCINYELSDFKYLLTRKVSGSSFVSNGTVHSTIPSEIITTGNRNVQLFRLGMRFAKCKVNLTSYDIGAYLQTLNEGFTDSPLPLLEIDGIARSVYRYWENDSIRFGSVAICENAGAMGFEKIKGLSRDEYENEVRHRRQLSAERTNSLLSKEQKQEAIATARAVRSEKIKAKIEQTLAKCQAENIKPTISAIAKIAGADRKTVRGYVIPIKEE
jgi:Primase C terminal 1 (PriCT-1)